MSCLVSLFACCFPKCPECTTAQHQLEEGPVTSRSIYDHYSHASGDGNGDSYTSAPLPAYTPRPGMNIQEKTLEAHMRDPAISNETQHQHLPQDTATDSAAEEKQRLAWEESAAANNPSSPNYNPNYNYYYNYHYSHFYPRPEEVSSDVSSAISFPSSYGNTSTATRETPPPPYSPRFMSPAPSRSMSVSSAHPPQMPMPMAAITQPPPVFQAGRTRRSIDEQLARASASSTPVPGAARARFSWDGDRR
ncbi:hypothetical protein BDV18DRAFT_135900 [Aspergillus unguis]